MSFCPNCGGALQQNEAFCPSCGTAVQQNPVNQYAQPQAEALQYQPEPQAPAENKKNITPIILGALGIVFAWIFALAGHGLSIAGIVLGVKEYKATKNVVGLVLSIIGEVCAIISSVSGIITVWQAMGII